MDNIITDISYTNKDFQSIYPELLDLVKKLTNRWDPSLSNESDPGVILLKLNALVADKNNYNIDKNVLECFPQSVTQYGNARKIYDLVGYNMNHYISAVVQDLKFQLKSNYGSDTYTLPQFTQLTDENNEISFYTLTSTVIQKDEIVSINAIEGKLHDYTVNDSTIINLNNLDNNLRLYFDEQQIAQNGIFIKSANSVNDFQTEYQEIPDDATDVWKRVDNLATYISGSKIYQFGVLPNSNICYIQFPQDISSIIGNGIEIKYIVSNGLNGNIKKNTLTKFVDDLKVSSSDNTIVNSYINIGQSKGTANGMDPETLSEAYNNYKKTVGTFDTLVTKRDFENYIYSSLKSITNEPYVSNVKVSDRTNDINHTNYVYKNEDVLNETKELVSDKISISEIIPYALQWVGVSDRISYNNVFKYTNQIANQTFTSKLNGIKALPVEFKTLEDDDTALYINDYSLNGNLITYYKVTTTEKKEIEENVRLALYRAYQPRNLEYGKEIAYEDLIGTIKNADDRIKTVILDNPVLTTKKKLVTGFETILTDDDYNKLIARMVTAGNIQLYKHLDGMQFDFGELSLGSPYVTSSGGSDKIKSITTEFNCKIPTDNNNPLTLGLNEHLYLLKPSSVTTTQYIAPVKYQISGFNDNLPCNKSVTLVDDQKIILTYTESESSIPKTITYTAGTTINFTSGDSTKSNTTTATALKTSEQINIIKENAQTLNYNSNVEYFFILDNKRITDTTFEFKADDYIILSDNEYLIVKSTLSDELILYQVGTHIKNTGNNIIYIKPTDVILDELEDTSSLDWNKFNSENDSIEIKQLDVTILDAGTKVWAKEEVAKLSNNYNTEQNNEIYYQTVDSADIITFKADLDTQDIYIRSALDINTTAEKPQEIKDNHTVTLVFDDDGEETITKETGGAAKFIKFNYPLIISGGDNIDVSVYTAKQEYLYSAYVYEKQDFIERDSQIIKITSNNLGNNKSLDLPFNFSHNSPETGYVFPVEINTNNCNITFNDCILFNDKDNSNATGLKSGIYYIQPTIKTISISISGSLGDDDYINIGYITKLDGYNMDDIEDKQKSSYNLSSNAGDIIVEINNNISEKFNWLHKVSDIYKVKTPTAPEGFWDLNHIANEFTLPRISEDINIVVNANSVK